MGPGTGDPIGGLIFLFLTTESPSSPPGRLLSIPQRASPEGPGVLPAQGCRVQKWQAVAPTSATKRRALQPLWGVPPVPSAESSPSGSALGEAPDLGGEGGENAAQLSLLTQGVVW